MTTDVKIIQTSWLRKVCLGWGDADQIEIRPYSPEPDSRIGWDQTFLVLVRGRPAGFTDGDSNEPR